MAIEGEIKTGNVSIESNVISERETKRSWTAGINKAWKSEWEKLIGSIRQELRNLIIDERNWWDK